MPAPVHLLLQDAEAFLIQTDELAKERLIHQTIFRVYCLFPDHNILQLKMLLFVFCGLGFKDISSI